MDAIRAPGRALALTSIATPSPRRAALSPRVATPSPRKGAADPRALSAENKRMAEEKRSRDRAAKEERLAPHARASTYSSRASSRVSVERNALDEAGAVPDVDALLPAAVVDDLLGAAARAQRATATAKHMKAKTN